MSPIDDATRRARAMRSARSDEMRRALAHRICFDLQVALRNRRPATITTTRRSR